MSFKDFMYDCFKKDVAAGIAANAEIPRHLAFDPATHRSKLRTMTFNVHFFQKGFSGVCLGDATDEVLGVIERVNPDLLMLQEVPPSLLSSLREKLASIHGLAHFVAAGSADVLLNVAHAEAAGLVLGTKAPVMLTSRADNEKARLVSCALAQLYDAWKRTGRSPVLDLPC